MKAVIAELLKLSRHNFRKGQISFELIIVIGVILLIAGVILTDVGNESTDLVVLSGVRNTALQEIAMLSLEKSKCSNTFLESMSFSDNAINLKINGDMECMPSAATISNKVESSVCSVKPNNDNEISCSGKTYSLSIGQ